MKALFLGLGGVGQRHLRNMLKLFPDTKVGAVRHCNRTFEISNDLQVDYSVNIMDKYSIKSFSSLADGLKWHPDLAIVSTPSHYHVEPTIQLLGEKIPVFLEKPVSHNYDNLDKLMKLSKDNNTEVMVGYMLHFHPGVKQLFEAVNNKKIGRIYNVQVTMSSYMPSWHQYEKYNEFYAGMKKYGGGVILTGIHPVDLIYTMFRKPKSLLSLGGKLSDLDINVEDTITTLFDYEIDGKKMPVTLTMSFVQRPLEHFIAIRGEKGKLYWDEISGHFSYVDGLTNEVYTIENKSFERNDMFTEEMKHFVDCLKSGKRTITSISKIIEGHIIALKMKESLITSSVISL